MHSYTVQSLLLSVHKVHSGLKTGAGHRVVSAFNVYCAVYSALNCSTSVSMGVYLPPCTEVVPQQAAWDEKSYTFVTRPCRPAPSIVLLASSASASPSQSAPSAPSASSATLHCQHHQHPCCCIIQTLLRAQLVQHDDDKFKYDDDHQSVVEFET